jgi:hypothetical protein
MLKRYKVVLELRVEDEDNIDFTWLEEVIGEHLTEGGGEHIKVLRVMPYILMSDLPSYC